MMETSRRVAMNNLIAPFQCTKCANSCVALGLLRLDLPAKGPPDWRTRGS